VLAQGRHQCLSVWYLFFFYLACFSLLVNECFCGDSLSSVQFEAPFPANTCVLESVSSCEETSLRGSTQGMPGRSVSAACNIPYHVDPLRNPVSVGFCLGCCFSVSTTRSYLLACPFLPLYHHGAKEYPYRSRVALWFAPRFVLECGCYEFVLLKTKCTSCRILDTKTSTQVKGSNSMSCHPPPSKSHGLAVVLVNYDSPHP